MGLGRFGKSAICAAAGPALTATSATRANKIAGPSGQRHRGRGEAAAPSNRCSGAPAITRPLPRAATHECRRGNHGPRCPDACPRRQLHRSFLPAALGLPVAQRHTPPSPKRKRSAAGSPQLHDGAPGAPSGFPGYRARLCRSTWQDRKPAPTSAETPPQLKPSHFSQNHSPIAKSTDRQSGVVMTSLCAWKTLG